MPMSSDPLQWIPLISLLCYIPLVCYMDLKYREVEDGWWNLLMIINFPIFIMVYLLGVYDPLLLWVSLATVGIYFLATKLNLMGGADFKYLAFISLFFIVNPLNGHVLIPLVMFEFLISSIESTGVCLITLNFFKSKPLHEITREFPMMLVISMAFILTVVLG